MSAICWDISYLQGRYMHCVKCTEHCVPDNNLFVCLCPSYSLSPSDKSASPCLPPPPNRADVLIVTLGRQTLCLTQTRHAYLTASIFLAFCKYHHFPADRWDQENTKLWPNIGLMLGHRRRRWPNINPALGQSFLFAGECFINPFTAICWSRRL